MLCTLNICNYLFADTLMETDKYWLKSRIVGVNAVAFAGIFVSGIDFVNSFVRLTTSKECFWVIRR